MASPIDPQRFRLIPTIDRGTTSHCKKPPRHKPSEKFLKGPIPLTWLSVAMQQQGKALHVGVALWFWAGVKRTRTISLNLTRLEGDFCIRRHSASRALVALEKAKLILVSRHQGRAPVVTLLDALDSNGEEPK
jgi:hypothetical protein